MHSRKKMSVVASVLVFSMLFAACSKKLPPETRPTILDVDGPGVEVSDVIEDALPPETEAEVVEEEPSLVFSTAVVTDKIVESYGQLQVIGTNLCDSEGNPVRLEGMSTYGLNGMYGFVNENTIQTLAEDWGCDIVRFAMTTHANDDSYFQDPDKYFNMMCDYVDLCIAQGIYCIVDWHILYDGDPNQHKAEAIDFFSRISAIYGDNPNVIYEICNEPNGECFDNPDEEVGWNNCIKPYAEEVISAIRANDPDNVIIVGTPNWSQDVEVASENPIDAENIMYTVHFYAGSHGQEFRDKVQQALDNGLPIFCTEWGTTLNTGAGEIFYEETLAWLTFFDENNISWCNWSIGGSQTEASNALKYVSNMLTIEEKIGGHWPDEFLSRSGLFVRAMILDQEFVIPE